MNIIRLAEHPELAAQAARWFSAKWDIPSSEYLASMKAAVAFPDSMPQWYVAQNSDRIIAGFGIIENDFHDRPDLAPNLCALFVEKEHRLRGLARALLDFARKETTRLGRDRLYLITDHDTFYERCGWEFLGYAHEADGELIRLYGADADTSPSTSAPDQANDQASEHERDSRRETADRLTCLLSDSPTDGKR